jgi:hypothetical protein
LGVERTTAAGGKPASKNLLLLVIKRMIHTPQQGCPHDQRTRKHAKRIAERKGFRLDRAGHGKGHGRFYIVNLAEGGRMRSGVLDHEYSFSLEEAEAWLDAHAK